MPIGQFEIVVSCYSHLKYYPERTLRQQNMRNRKHPVADTCRYQQAHSLMSALQIDVTSQMLQIGCCNHVLWKFKSGRNQYRWCQTASVTQNGIVTASHIMRYFISNTIEWVHKWRSVRHSHQLIISHSFFLYSGYDVTIDYAMHYRAMQLLPGPWKWCPTP